MFDEKVASSACGTADPKPTPACGTKDPEPAPACGAKDPEPAPACGAKDPEAKKKARRQFRVNWRLRFYNEAYFV